MISQEGPRRRDELLALVANVNPIIHPAGVPFNVAERKVVWPSLKRGDTATA
jgi:hypothetical protein